MQFCPNSLDRVCGKSGLETPPTIYEIGCSKIRKYVHISIDNNPDTISLAKFPNFANVKVIVDFTVKAFCVSSFCLNQNLE